jgi:hypothetical protein
MIPQYIQIRILRAVKTNSRFDAEESLGCYRLIARNSIRISLIWKHPDFATFYESIAYLRTVRQMTPAQIEERLSHASELRRSYWEKPQRETIQQRIERLRTKLLRMEAA